jgi:hypothetical protein
MTATIERKMMATSPRADDVAELVEFLNNPTTPLSPAQRALLAAIFRVAGDITSDINAAGDIKATGPTVPEFSEQFALAFSPAQAAAVLTYSATPFMVTRGGGTATFTFATPAKISSTTVPIPPTPSSHG